MSSRRDRYIQPDGNINPPNTGNFTSAGNTENPGSTGNSGGQFNMNNLGQLLNNIDIKQVMNQFSQMGGSPQEQTQGAPSKSSKDPRIDLLQAIKPFVSSKRGGMIDKIGQFYAITKIIQNTNKKR